MGKNKLKEEHPLVFGIRKYEVKAVREMTLSMALPLLGKATSAFVCHNFWNACGSLESVQQVAEKERYKWRALKMESPVFVSITMLSLKDEALPQ